MLHFGGVGSRTVAHLCSELNLEPASEIQVAILMVDLRQSADIGRDRSVFEHAPSPNIAAKLNVTQARQL